jgi:hypothetical protein
MKFVGTVVRVCRHDNEEGPHEDGREKLMSVQLLGKVAGLGVLSEVDVPAHLSGSYTIGRRVRVTIEPA